MGFRIVQFLLSVAATAIAGIPFWLFLGARSMLSPEGFLQNFFVFGAGMYFLGVFQFLFFVGWIFVLVFIWSYE
ncbi:hypothetical protein KKB69_00195 [Patescibacteria group bacterium]|nr:hypothetical protein [Patescibacteria group bacterium]